jgi:hypothetical protein
MSARGMYVVTTHSSGLCEQFLSSASTPFLSASKGSLFSSKCSGELQPEWLALPPQYKSVDQQVLVNAQVSRPWH